MWRPPGNCNKTGLARPPPAPPPGIPYNLCLQPNCMLLLFLSFPLIHSLSIFSSFLSTSPSFSHCQPRRPLLIVNYDADASPEMHHHLTTPLLHRGAGGRPAWPWPGYSGLSLHQVAPCRHFWLHSCPGQSRCQETIGQKTK